MSAFTQKRHEERLKHWYWRAYWDAKRWVKDAMWETWTRFIWRPFFHSRIFVKQSCYGKKGSESELATLRFLRKHTSIPVPKPYFSFQFRGSSYLLMSRIPGEELGRQQRNGFAKLPIEVQDTVLSQLATYFAELRALPPPPGCVISTCEGGPLVGELRLSEQFGDPVGPFHTEEEFNAHLRNQGPLEDAPERIRAFHTKQHKLVFTHGDIAPRNIIVEDGRVTGVIDWENAGWFPEYWEYVKAVGYKEWEERAFKKRVREFLRPYNEEVELDALLVDTYGLCCE